MGGKSAPPPPDYTGAAQQQAGASQQATAGQTAANRPDQYGPYGSTTWTQKAGQMSWQVDPKTGMTLPSMGPSSWEQHTGFSGPMGQANDALQQQYAQANAQGIDYSKLPQANPYGGQYNPFDPASMQKLTSFDPSSLGSLSVLNPSAVPQYGMPDLQHLDSPGTGMEARNKAEDALYARASSRLDPQWQQREQGMRTQLLNQGLDENSAAFQKAMDDFGRQRNDAYGQARNDAVAGGGQEQALQFGMGLQGNNQQLQQQQMAQARALQNAQLGYQGYGLGLQAQGQQFGQQQAANQQALQAQGQQFGQGLTANQQLMQGQQQRYGQQMQGQQAQYGQGIDARRQALMEALQQRLMPLQQMQGMQGMLGHPGFMGAGMAQSPQLLQALALLGNYNLGAHGQDSAMWGDIGQGVGSLFNPQQAMGLMAMAGA